jgi:hypothetical protein
VDDFVIVQERAGMHQELIRNAVTSHTRNYLRKATAEKKADKRVPPTYTNLKVF